MRREVRKANHLQGVQLYEPIYTYRFDTLLIHQHQLFMFYGEVRPNSVPGEWVKSTPNVPTGEVWRPDFQFMPSQPLAPPSIVWAAQTANKVSELQVHSISSPGNTLKGKQVWSFPSP